ncbi:hypothetical protein CGC56_05975 [Capnocytophaga canimorsus]|uniref:Uncharacterized protein n=2 Tax=Capnocytophaga canimorsus TaxID=28188 RepID=A0A250G610_9FLAO|nr:hypothetical protein [Capnocytophaga canimorsus]ATA91758.1 hypothetical protein CGC56_05975 [Capnocytophaga canimorsus]
MKNMPLLLKVLDERQLTKNKTIVIVNALCTLLFNNIEISDRKYNEETKQQMQQNKAIILPELQKRKETILQYQSTIWDYIWKEIAPYLC